MIKVLFAGPITGKTGGIAVWSQKFVRLFPDTEFQLVPIDLTTKMTNVSNPSPLYRIRKGLSRFWELRKDAINAIRQNPDIRIMHTTTSGSFGTVRDLMMVNLCHKHNIKCIMHCRYGCIPEDFNSKGFLGWLLRKTMYKYEIGQKIKAKAEVRVYDPQAKHIKSIWKEVEGRICNRFYLSHRAGSGGL